LDAAAAVRLAQATGHDSVLERVLQMFLMIVLPEDSGLVGWLMTLAP
jgi:hypothetical protein